MLVKVHNDIVSAIDNQSYIILLLLDLSAAFHTVDHKILLQRLSCRFGIDGKALRWFDSYLENRKQVVNVKGTTSCSKDLRCGVPQGSVLGPILYVLYTSPLGDIVRSHGFLRWWHPALLPIKASWSSGFSASNWVLMHGCLQTC